ncbi:PBP1A family penicillin-binding protein [Desulfosporosinus sp. OT]|uniref:transglycosylase domain-containing protein n=1 Tax=Desulfosporosinus sp. OT TaxID=913865 RepID=UPI000223A049|nr:PBP1A family penicillin-binding protein [Desulfosporosinus sp. OT]EGW37267.1 penicillin-binding, 1A family protein [Desulfosporosinus sp. OT]
MKKLPREAKYWRKLGVGILAFLVLIIGGMLLWITSLDVSKLESPLSQPSVLYDENGHPASQLSSSRIIPISQKQIPQQLKNAIIAVEDRRFYEHQGVDIHSISRALIRDLISGGLSEGGSTITQQLAKNLFLPSDKTFSRKIKEAAYAIKIEYVLDKDQILVAYLNQIYFGEGCWGIHNAAQFYFKKKVEDLTLEESAMLAGLPKAPSSFSPLKNMDKSLERRNLVLELMKEQGYISATDYEETSSQPILLKQGSEESLTGQYAPYVDYVIEEAINRMGFTEAQILSGGLQIYTQMNPEIQEEAQDVYKDKRFFPDGKEDQTLQSGVIIIDHHTGGIKALVGYRGESIFREFNHATQLKRQPGSSFKPLAVYGPALEKGYTSNSLLNDNPLNINGYAPTDEDHRNRGYITLQEALQNSLNIPAVWLLNKIGIDCGVDFATRAGIPLEDEDHTLSLALGGLTQGVSPLQMAQAYGAFANLGVMNKAYAITKITSKEGQVLFQSQPASVKVTTPAVAYRMTLLLENVVDYGTGRNAYLGRPTAGKTGSVELPPIKEFSGITKGAKDVWFVGYTPELTAAVWMGYDKTDRNHYLTTTGGSGPAVVFHEILSRSLSSTPVVPFEVPSEYVSNQYRDLKQNDQVILQKDSANENNSDESEGPGEDPGEEQDQGQDQDQVKDQDQSQGLY